MKSFMPTSKVLTSENENKRQMSTSTPVLAVKMTQPMSVILVIITLVITVSGFNLAPQPNYVFKEPSLQTYMQKVRTSLFGFALNLRPGGVIVGAPRAQSNLASQRKINETGAIYKCHYNTGECVPYYVDRNGNTNNENEPFAYSSEKKDYQMLGASMDGHGSDGDRFVVCAPKIVSELVDYYLLHGICYVTDGTETAEPKSVRPIYPLRVKDKQLYRDKYSGVQYYHYMYGEQGLSVHVTDDNEEILIGAPGVFNWRGTVIRYRRQINEDMGGLSRRDEHRKQTNRQKRQIISYVADVPNPYFTPIEDDSYFGYAVSSGFFQDNTKLLYVASAPQMKLQTGEVYIFDIINADTFRETQIKIMYTFPGQQQGEYFGYALVTEDFNGDGLPDLAISAPMHSKNLEYDNGVVYVYLNEGKLSFNLQTTLSTQYELSGRFGTSLAKIGDINMDGYNDIAIGAPFEENGAVYIYHGSSGGLLTKPSQRLIPPENGLIDPSTQPMFGHAISRGNDIDNNGYNDLAIGAPNGETVYVYKTYPVVRVFGSVTSSKRELSPEDTAFQLTACWRYESATNIQHDVSFGYSLKVDAQNGRAQLHDGNNFLNGSGKINYDDFCQEYDVRVKPSFADIYKPIYVEFTYNVISNIPTNSEFCERCVMTDPTASNSIREKISFKTGCAGETCIAALKLRATWLDLTSPYVIGSTRTASLQYEVVNSGENAFLPQLNITLPSLLSLAKLPPQCKLTNLNDGLNLLCDLNNGLPLKTNADTKMALVMDMTKLEGKSFSINADVFSTSDEKDKEDNSLEMTVDLQEFSEIEVVGKASVSEVNLEEQSGKINVTYQIQVMNNGPSSLRDLTFKLKVPLVYYKPSSADILKIINFNDIRFDGYYNYKHLDFTWTQNNVILLPNPKEYSTQPPEVDNLYKASMDFGLLSGDSNPPNDEVSLSTRRRRSTEAFSERHYNRYTNEVIEHSRSRRSLTTVNPAILTGLPANRTLLFHCGQEVRIDCAEVSVQVANFKPGNIPIVMNMQFELDLDQVARSFLEREDIFALQILSELQKMEDEEGVAFSVAKNNPFTVVYKHAVASTPLWVYIVSAIGGVLLLVLISYGLYKAGFFKRAKKEEIEKLHRESVRMNQPDTDDEH
ncbi:integrin alpha-PS3-like [Toxorhynchites rutilus septentrionalis]|uniref:integrin alpha-PS3-like n=1 Tax=Toxorhynchites rutilus septentrionalis TaxID=329112 RepID=UPI0024787CCE|nr:integrin alpha-PS3-like [Toxorhynchites rutilus septentrionalis]XP_055623804.1 integrin alpha-PS3-like [Toxorhynchites rutilus septentrionalis]XP_055623805.1 integrin alpha-PS3-like [Toxorhynchites rutilus septentrionalis]XP_055623806.1 integrin alpha-PS3-like [Toxorhynchites rutilus septentrionalis]XP_055623807.1 integrin alpha-PS3-like [Toxorhynchites rutilus septentrionalis]XP_055623808.1 integrin alpha-PS3-like [Toxorhynchites rutilus septentrionalis]